MIIYSKKIDFFLIKFPIVFPIIYLGVLFAYPEYGMAIAFMTLIILAEPHFGATWSLFFDVRMRNYIKQNQLLFILMPVLISGVAALLFFKYENIFYILFLSYNIFHVTKQSVGICKLFSLIKNERLYQEYSIIFINLFSFCGITVYHLLGLLTKQDAQLFGFILLIISLLITFFQKITFNSWEKSLTTFTGLSIFIPGFFVDEAIHAIVAGVTMHYSQYLLMMFKIHMTKLNNTNQKIILKQQNFKLTNFLFLIFIYGIVAVLLTTLSQESKVFSNLIFIPLLGQILHFYIDGLIWNFKDKKLRDINLNYLTDNVNIKNFKL